MTEISSVYLGIFFSTHHFHFFSVSWTPPPQWRNSAEHLLVFEFIEEILSTLDDDDNDEDMDDDDNDEEITPPFQIRKDLLESENPKGRVEIVLNIEDEKYWNIKKCRVRIQANYQMSEFSQEVEVNIRNAVDEKYFFEELERIVKDSNGKGVKTKDLFGERI